MESSSKKRKKVKDIFPPRQLKPHPFGQKKTDEESILIRPSEVKSVEYIQEEESITVVTPSSRLTEAPATRKDKGIWNKKFKTFLGVFSLLIIFYYLGFVVLSRAEIDIFTKKTEMPFSGVVLIDRNVFAIDSGKAVVPGNLFVFKADESQEFSSTGLGKDEQKAKGIITIYNNYSTSPQILVATTRFETPDNKIFRLNSRVVIPGATTRNGELVPSTIEVKVTADKPGPGYNIETCNLPDCKFTIPGFSGMPEFNGFYGISTKAMSGGTSGSVPMVSSEDLKKAEEVILQKIMDSIDQDLENKVPEESKVLSEAKSGIKITRLSSDAEIGDYRGNFTVTAEGEIKIIAFNENNLVKYIHEVLEKDRDEDYDFCQQPQLEYSDLETDFEAGTLKMSVKANQMLCHKLSLDEIKEAIIGKNKEELNEIFQDNPGIQEVRIKFWPWWVRRVPHSLEKVKLSVD